jgi:hypothetical protein
MVEDRRISCMGLTLIEQDGVESTEDLIFREMRD